MIGPVFQLNFTNRKGVWLDPHFIKTSAILMVDLELWKPEGCPDQKWSRAWDRFIMYSEIETETHRHGQQTYGYQRGKAGGGVN